MRPATTIKGKSPEEVGDIPDLRQGKQHGYIEVYESSPYLESRLIMPRNLFLISAISNTRQNLFIVTEDKADANQSLVVSNYTAGSKFRAN